MFDFENENILKTIFKSSLPDSWKENPDFGEYLAELGSYGVEKLGKEPDRLAEEKAAVLEQTQELAFHNYKTFIQAADCSKEIFQDFTVIEKRVESLVEKMPEFVEKCQKFSKQSQSINASRHVNTVTLAKHSQLLEILEIPQLMDTCIRNNYYDEALELATYVRRLERKHASISIIASIVKEVQESLRLMLNQLLQKLRTDLQLPSCLKVIGYLRRMEAFTEAELRLKFFQARDSWFQAILNSIPSEDPYYHISKTVEASRVHLFDIVTQYRALFSDDEPLLYQNRDLKCVNESAIFHTWLLQKIGQFLKTLEHDLRRGVSGRLDSLLGQCMYFGLSFSRVGADFRGLLVPLFQTAAIDGFQSGVDLATTRFEELMQSYTLTNVPTSFVSPILGSSAITHDNLHPPISLLEFQPLAQYCNCILQALNELRLCAPITISQVASHCLLESLIVVADAIVLFYRAEESVFTQTERATFLRFCEQFVNQLVPHLDRCLQVLFPPAQIAQTLCVTAAEYSKLKGPIGALNCAEIVEHLQRAIPLRTSEITLPSETAVEEEDVQQVSDLGILENMRDSESIASRDREELTTVTDLPTTAAAIVDDLPIVAAATVDSVLTTAQATVPIDGIISLPAQTVAVDIIAESDHGESLLD